MAGPVNAIVGNDSFGTDIPQTEVDDNSFKALINTAKFSKTAEFKQLKEHLESRMDFYKTYLPNGKPVVGEQNPQELGYLWLAANTVNGEFQMLIDVYENAAREVKDELARRKNATA